VGDVDSSSAGDRADAGDRSGSNLVRLPDDSSDVGRVVLPEGDLSADHPMRKVTWQVAYESGWSPDRAGKVADLFNGMARKWDATRSSLLRTAPVLDALDRGGLRFAGRWLEVGAGTGIGSRTLAPAVEAAGGTLVTVDLALQMLMNAPSRVAPQVQADAGRLPFVGDQFDGVAMINMLLFPDEVVRVLASGGQLLWVNTSGEQTPIHLSPEEFVGALPGSWSARWARSGTGIWVVAERLST